MEVRHLFIHVGYTLFSLQTFADGYFLFVCCFALFLFLLLLFFFQFSEKKTDIQNHDGSKSRHYPTNKTSTLAKSITLN